MKELFQYLFAPIILPIILLLFPCFLIWLLFHYKIILHKKWIWIFIINMVLFNIAMKVIPLPEIAYAGGMLTNILSFLPIIIGLALTLFIRLSVCETLWMRILGIILVGCVIIGSILVIRNYMEERQKRLEVDRIKRTSVRTQ